MRDCVDRWVTPPKRVISFGVPHLYVNWLLLCFCCSGTFFLRLIVAFLYHVTDQFQRVYWPHYKNGVDCRGTAPLGLDIRDVAYENTALYSGTFHERGTCDGSSDLVLWRAWHTPESIVFHLHCYSCSVLYPLSCADIYCYLCFVTYYLRFW